MWKKKNQNQKEELFARSSLFRFSLSFIFILSVFTSLGGNTFYFNNNLLQAQRYNGELKLRLASSIIGDEESNDPHNSAIHYLANFNSFIKAFISEDKRDYIAHLDVQEKALDHYRDLPDSLPYKKFVQSEAYFYSAALKAKFNELYGAVRDMSKANSFIEENHEKFPSFLPNNKTRGLVKIYLSAVPENYKWAVKMLGVQGGLRDGLRLLHNLALHQSDTSELGGIARESGYLYAFSLFQVAHRPNKAWAEMLKYSKDYKSNLLSNFFRSNLAMKMNRNETALSVLSVRPKGPEYQDFYFLDYLSGTAKLNKLDPDAIVDLDIFYKNYGGRHYVKSCLQRMSWFYLVNDNEVLADYYKNLIPQRGLAFIENDKRAEHYVTKDKPDLDLLRTQLLYDGGYLNEAFTIISNVKGKELPNMNMKAEYCYRLGRIYEKKGEMIRALKLYEASSLYAIESEEYYGAYASIYLGDYYLNKENVEMAKKFYLRALNFKNNKEYVSSVEKRAKAGLEALN